MFRNKIVIAAMITFSGFAWAGPPKPFVVMDYSDTYSKDTFPRDSAWYGLYCTASNCEIRNAKVRITSSTAKNILDENEPIDVLHVHDSPIALFSGFPLKIGKVTTWFKADNPIVESEHYSKLKKLGHWQMPWGTTPLTISWVKLPEYGGFRYHISDGTTNQFLFRTDIEGHYGGETAPFIHWIGDLDGDGKIDLLLSLPDDNCGFDYRLYLSSLAGKGEFIHKAAKLSGRFAVCGC